MGSKMLKGVMAWGGTRRLMDEVVDKGRFMKINNELVRRVTSHPTYQALHSYGTNVLMNIIQSMGGLPAYNFTGRAGDVTPVSGEMIKDKYVVETHGCYNCPPIACTQMAAVKAGPFKVPGDKIKYEYENTWALGPNVGGDLEPDAVLKLQKAANELGMDTISLGNTLATAVELARKGKLKLDVDWGGDSATLIDLAYRIAHRDGIGDELAEGDYRLAIKYKDPESFIGSRGGQGVPAYDPRGG